MIRAFFPGKAHNKGGRHKRCPCHWPSRRSFVRCWLLVVTRRRRNQGQKHPTHRFFFYATTAAKGNTLPCHRSINLIDFLRLLSHSVARQSSVFVLLSCGVDVNRRTFYLKILSNILKALGGENTFKLVCQNCMLN